MAETTARELESPRRRVAWAKHRIKDLESQTAAFEDAKPYENVTEPDTERPNTTIHKIRLRMPFPDFLSEMAANIAADLRESLDQAGYAIAVDIGKPNALNTAFPFADSVANFENAIGRCKDLPEDIRALFRSFKPYKGGDDLLFALNRICVTNKHRVLVPVGISLVRGRGIATTFNTGWFETASPLAWDSAKNQIILARSATDSNFHCNFNVTLDVCFGEIEIVRGKPAIVTFNQLVSVVESVLLGLEAEARRLGYFK